MQVRRTLPHDPKAFTQGLEMSGGMLYEGTGLTGHSSVRAGAPGERPSARTNLPARIFGEGITLVGRDRLWQLTWQDGIAYERDPKTLRERRQVRYEGEGWGLCHDAAGRRLVMSDGSARLAFRDPESFRKTGEVTVRRAGRPVAELNELECAGPHTVYANVFQSDEIVRIDTRTGAVTGAVDASGLLPASERSGSAAVLNGIAAIPGTDEFYVTGKNWPKLFRVRFVPKG
ncbi:glutaminyl-peptide cyclotransferase [Streptomyces boninensis]|uniref:glutaminyl-peptide cyclotransferase n=1 Tax=Streptomyces boninensis TaxID=2039455 RepID=UPI003B20DB2F